MNRLREMRKDRDLSQEDLSNILNVSQPNYGKYETEKVNIPIELLHQLADFYNVSIDYLLYRTDNRKPYDISIMRIKNNTRKRKEQVH